MLRYLCIVPLLALGFSGCSQPSSQPPSAKHTLAQSAGTTRPAQAPITWVRYTDSAEGAFSMDVPVGWQVQGGMWRFGYFDPRWMMSVRSLDGSTIIRIDDVNIPPYALPGPSTGSQGQAFVRPQQFQMIVSDYHTGAQYARLYGAHRFADVCSRLAVQPGRAWRPALAPVFRATRGAVRSSQGSIAYSCRTRAGNRIAIVYARTVQYPVQWGSGFWVVDPIVSILTDPRDRNMAVAMTQHMMDSCQKNPQWAAYQNRLTQIGLNGIMANFQNFMHQMQIFDQQRRATMDNQVAGFESRMNAQAAQVSSFGDTLTGLQSVSDPMTGGTFKVFTGPHSNYYSDGGVTINSDISPGAGFHQLNNQ